MYVFKCKCVFKWKCNEIKHIYNCLLCFVIKTKLVENTKVIFLNI